MDTEEFAERLEKADRRRRSSAIANERKRERNEAILQQYIDGIEVSRPEGYTYEMLIDDAVSDWEARQHDAAACGDDADKRTKERWAVNYVRHVLCDYDSWETGYQALLDNTKGMVGNRDNFKWFKDAVLSKIAQAYPELKDAVEEQTGRLYEREYFDEDAFADYHHLRRGKRRDEQ